MKTLLLLPAITLLAAIVSSEYRTLESGGAVLAVYFQAVNDTTEFDQQEALKMLRDEIKGKEDQPAGEVFKNIKMMKQVPAGRLLRIMEFGFSQSLGVTCTHCHNPNNFADEEKRQKQITRDMMVMAGKINNELLANIDNIESDKPTINCTTCHRGEVTPALNLNN